MTTDKIKKYWPWFAVFALAVALGASFGMARNALADVQPVECIAHRGAPTDHTEETQPTYQASIDAGAQVEGDVRFTSTGYPMMLHDPTLGQFRAPTLALNNLTQTQAQSHTSATGDTMLSLWGLRTLLLAHPGSRAQIEMKETMTPAKWDMIDSRLKVLQANITISSFSETTIRQAQDRGYRAAWLLAAPSSAVPAGVEVQDYGTITAAHVADLRALGVAVQAYTPDTVAEWDVLAADGVSALVTDDYTGCAAWEDAR